MRSLTLRMGCIIVAVAAVQLAIGWASYAHLMHRFDRALDSDLRIQADALRSTLSTIVVTPTHSGANAWSHVEQASAPASAFQYWSGENQLRFASPALSQLALDALAPGFADITIDGRRWRVLTELDGGRWIRVAQHRDTRAVMARSALLQVFLFFGVGLPVLVAGMARVSRYALAPVRELGEDIARCIPGDSGPIGPGEAPRELEPIVASVNTLLARFRAAPRTLP